MNDFQKRLLYLHCRYDVMADIIRKQLCFVRIENLDNSLYTRTKFEVVRPIVYSRIRPISVGCFTLYIHWCELIFILCVQAVQSLQYRMKTVHTFFMFSKAITKITDKRMAKDCIYISDTDKHIMMQILSSISNILFKEKKYENILIKRYKEMEEQCNWDFPDGPTDNGCAVKYVPTPKEYQDFNSLGFDIPTLLRMDTETPIRNIIMVVSQDPKRTERYKGMLSLSSSFGFHDKSYRENTRKGFMTPLVLQALKDNSGTAIYFTDCHKLCTQDDKRVSKADTSKYQEILKKEIELIKPSCIIAHGRAAEAILKKITPEPHFVPYIGNSHKNRKEREQAKADFIKFIKNNN